MIKESQEFEEKKKELDARIQELKLKVKQKEDEIEKQEKTMSEQPLHPSFISLKNTEKIIKKRLEKVNFELSQRKPMQDLLIRQKNLEAKSKGNLIYSGSSPDIWGDLNRWEKMPEIVQKKFDEQENEIKLKQARLQMLIELVEKRRLQYLKEFEKGLNLEKAKWEQEWNERIEEEVMEKRNVYENMKRDLEFKVRHCEISLYKESK